MAGTNAGKFTGTAAALGTVKDTAGKGIAFKITAGGAETVSVTGATSSGTATAKIMAYSLATGALHSTVDMASGSYYIPRVFTANLIFLGSAAVETKTVEFIVSDLS